ncbi:MAG: helicase [Planctomycetes bacterium]|nr:helicase [Planctomycetota bacterium]
MTLPAESMLCEDGPLARRLSGFETRPQQVEMARRVEETLAKRGRLLVEAGTGVGKSFAYLIPAIARAVEAKERVVISTYTISLQEQLIEKDLPLLRAASSDEFSAVLVKGRGNYVSLRRLKLASERQERLFGDEEDRHQLHAIEDWAMTTRDGTLSSLPVLKPDSIWDQVQSDTHNCMGKRCPTYDKCFYQSARRRMENADILVCNHALFFSDLAMRARGRGFLPDYAHAILDEAHEIETVASEHFGSRLTESGVRHLLRTLVSSSGKGYLPQLRLQSAGLERVEQAVRKVELCEHAAEALFMDLRHLAQNGSTDPESAGEQRVLSAAAVEDALSGPMGELAGTLRMLRESAGEADQFELNAFAERAEAHANTCRALVAQEIPGCVYWVEARRRGRKRGRATVELQAAAVDVAPLLREQLFSRNISVVLTSATLATDADDFSLIARRLGCDDAQTVQLGSPFDLPRQVKFIVDATMPGPADEGFEPALADRILRHVRETDGGAFVLFTSLATMERVARVVETELGRQQHPFFVQGRGLSRTTMLERFRDDTRSVLFGVNSFWQGVDVRGDGLRNVIITRLPFESPDKPLTKARGEKLTREGGDSFRDDQLPRAVLRFRQGFGRLIRSSQDFGRVVVLDSRILRKSYGRAFLKALPEGVEPEIDEGEGIDPPGVDE